VNFFELFLLGKTLSPNIRQVEHLVVLVGQLNGLTDQAAPLALDTAGCPVEAQCRLVILPGVDRARLEVATRAVHLDSAPIGKFVMPAPLSGAEMF